MQINNLRATEIFPFFDIEIGEEFMWDGRLHMRTDNEEYNAVDLEDGTLRHFPNNAYVGAASAIITIQP